MLEFYEFNTLNICIVLILIFIIYNILCKLNTDSKNKKNINIEYLIISIIISFIISLLISYYLTENDEKLLTDNYWDPLIEK